jgi:TRAP-type mannitol/chloroaromatic compound transport system permease small subunit
MFLIATEVIMRYVFREPTIWNNDVQLYLSAFQRIIGIGYASMLHNQIVMDIFVNNLSFRKSKAIELFGYLVYHLPLVAALIFVTEQRTLLTFSTGEKYYSIWRPLLWPILLLITLAYVFFVVQIFAETTKCVIHLQRGNDAWLKER